MNFFNQKSTKPLSEHAQLLKEIIDMKNYEKKEKDESLKEKLSRIHKVLEESEKYKTVMTIPKKIDNLSILGKFYIFHLQTTLFKFKKYENRYSNEETSVVIKFDENGKTTRQTAWPSNCYLFNLPFTGNDDIIKYVSEQTSDQTSDQTSEQTSGQTSETGGSRKHRKSHKSRKHRKSRK